MYTNTATSRYIFMKYIYLYPKKVSLDQVQIQSLSIRSYNLQSPPTNGPNNTHKGKSSARFIFNLIYVKSFFFYQRIFAIFVGRKFLRLLRMIFRLLPNYQMLQSLTFSIKSSSMLGFPDEYFSCTVRAQSKKTF